MSSDWRSADALRDGGALMIDDDSAVAGGSSEPAVPASPRKPYSERPGARTRRAKAQGLIERLVAKGRVRITDPDDDEVTEWRRVVNYAKRHGLEPAGKRIEKVPYGEAGLGLFLADGPHPNARSQRPKEGGDPVPVPSRLGNLHPIVTALKDDERRLIMPSGLRRRSLLLLQGLSSEAVRRGYEVRKAHSFFHPRESGVDIVVDGLAYTAGVRQEFPRSTDPDRSSWLVVELAHGLTDRPGLARPNDPDARRGPGRGPWRDPGTSGTRRSQRRQEEQQVCGTRSPLTSGRGGGERAGCSRTTCPGTTRRSRALAGVCCPQRVLRGIGMSYWRASRRCGRADSEPDPALVGVGKGVREVDRPLARASEDAGRTRTHAAGTQAISRRMEP